MKKFLVVLFAGLMLALPSTAFAQTPARSHVATYLHLRHIVVAKYGLRAAGRNIVVHGLSNGHRATDRDIVRSIEVFHRTLSPPTPVAVVSEPSYTAPSYAPTATTSAYMTPTYTAPVPVASTAPTSGLEACIIARESGGNSQATDGIYAGEGQWSPSAWAQDGGTAYAPTPLGASAAQQQQVLANEGAAGMSQQQGVFDGCG
jgi:hypothetical protein